VTSKRDDALAESRGRQGRRASRWQQNARVAHSRFSSSRVRFLSTIAESEQGQGGKRIIILNRRVLDYLLCVRLLFGNIRGVESDRDAWIFLFVFLYLGRQNQKLKAL
jgi:hypothetical protein